MNSIFNRPYWQLAILSGLLVGLSYPPLRLGFLAWFGFVPLIHVLLNVTPKSAAKYAYLAAITANTVTLYWIGFNSGAGFAPVFASLVGAILYLALFWALFGFGIAWVHKRIGNGLAILPFLWVSMEWIRSFGSLGFPWINLAVTQSQYLPLIQIIELTGTYGVAFWLMLMNTGAYLLLLNQEKRKTLLITLILFFGMWFFGAARLITIDLIDPEQEFNIAAVQPNIDPNEKWDREHRTRNFALMDSLLDQAIALQPALVLWPETALPTYLRLSSGTRRMIHKKVIQSNIPLLSGTVDRTIDSNNVKYYYNGTILLNTDKSFQMYYKVHLVPFAEYIPLSGYFPQLKKLNFGQGNFTHGTEYTVFNVDSINLSNVICYESSLPRVVRSFVKNGAQFMTIQANDGWLGRTSGPYQHFELARLRCVENRISIARSANTGISGIILPSGRVLHKIPLGTQKVFMGELPILGGQTFYTAFGDVFAGIISLFSIVCIGIIWARKKI